MTNKPKLADLLLSEISDFCAGFGQIGEPSTPEGLQSSLMDRVLPIIREADIQLEAGAARIAELEGERNRALKAGSAARKEFDAQYARAEKAEAELAAIRGVAVPVGVTAENLRVIQMLLNVCGAAFQLADDSCQQDVDGEPCHVVPYDAFSRLSDSLGEIENTLPDEYEDLPNIVLNWAAIPRHALRSIFKHPAPPVVVLAKSREDYSSKLGNGDIGPYNHGHLEGWNDCLNAHGFSDKSADGEG